MSGPGRWVGTAAAAQEGPRVAPAGTEVNPALPSLANLYFRTLILGSFFDLVKDRRKKIERVDVYGSRPRGGYGTKRKPGLLYSSFQPESGYHGERSNKP